MIPKCPMNIDDLPAAASLEHLAQAQQTAGSPLHLGGVLILPHRHLNKRL